MQGAQPKCRIRPKPRTSVKDCHSPIVLRKRKAQRWAARRRRHEVHDRVCFFKSLDIDPYEHVCAVCWEQVISRDCTWETYNSSILDPLQNECEQRNVELETYLRPGSADFAEPSNGQRRMLLCSPCKSSLRRKRLPANAVANGLQVLPVPSELSDLTPEECRAVSLIHPVTSIQQYRPHYANPTHPDYDTGQWFAAGNIACIRQDVYRLATKLPRRSELCKVVHLVRTGDRGQLYRSAVRPNHLRIALTWLSQNNPLYREIEIDEALLQSMEADTTLTQVTVVRTADDVADEKTEQAVYDHLPDDMVVFCTDEGDDGTSALNDTVADVLRGANTHATPPPVPEIHLTRGELVRDFDDPVFAMAFPELFPYGVGDIADNGSRTVNISRDAWARHMLLFTHSLDRRFTQSIQFIAMLGKLCLKSRANCLVALAEGRFQTGRAAPVKNEDLAGDVTEKTIRRLIPFAEKAPGTPLFFRGERQKLHDFCKSRHGGPLFFASYSPADIHHPHLHARLGSCSLQATASLTDRTRKLNIKANPVETTIEFIYRWDAFKKNILDGLYKPLGDTAFHFVKIESQGRGSLHAHYMLWPRWEWLAKLLWFYNSMEFGSAVHEDDVSTMVSGKPLFSVERALQTGNESFLEWFVDQHIHSFMCVPASPSVGTERSRHTQSLKKDVGEEETHAAPLVAPRVHAARLVPSLAVLQQNVAPRWSPKEGVIFPTQPNAHQIDLNTVKTDCLLHRCLAKSRCAPTTKIQRLNCHRRRVAMYGSHASALQSNLCLFNFPRRVQQRTRLVEEGQALNKVQGRLRVDTQRNNASLNAGNDVLLAAARCNIDVQLIDDVHNAAEYIASYASKSDQDCTGKTLRQQLERILADDAGDTSDVNAAGHAVLSKVAMYACANMNISVSRLTALLLKQKPASRNFDVENYPSMPPESIDQFITRPAPSAPMCIRMNKQSAYQRRPIALNHLSPQRFFDTYALNILSTPSLVAAAPHHRHILVDGVPHYDLDAGLQASPEDAADDDDAKSTESTDDEGEDVRDAEHAPSLAKTLRLVGERSATSRNGEEMVVVTGSVKLRTANNRASTLQVATPRLSATLHSEDFCAQFTRCNVPWRTEADLHAVLQVQRYWTLSKPAVGWRSHSRRVVTVAGSTRHVVQQYKRNRSIAPSTHTFASLLVVLLAGAQPSPFDADVLATLRRCLKYAANQQRIFYQRKLDAAEAKTMPSVTLSSVETPEEAAVHDALLDDEHDFQDEDGAALPPEALDDDCANTVRHPETDHASLGVPTKSCFRSIKIYNTDDYDLAFHHVTKSENTAREQRESALQERFDQLTGERPQIDAPMPWQGILCKGVDGSFRPRTYPLPVYTLLHALYPQQQEAASLFLQALERYLDSDYRVGHPYEFMHSVVGVAGAGKSVLVHAVTQAAQYVADRHRIDHLHAGEAALGPFYKTMAFTGVAAANIMGDTIHKTLGLTIFNNPKAVNATNIRIKGGTTFAGMAKGFGMLVIDEIYCISMVFLARIDTQLRSITGVKAPFGGFFVLLLGDPKQLAPIDTSGTPLYRPLDSPKINRTNCKELFRAQRNLGGTLWQSIRNATYLPTSYRHEKDPEFAKVLHRIRGNAATEEDTTFLRKRVLTHRELDASQSFRSALHIFPTNAQCWTHIVKRTQSAVSQEGSKLANVWAQVLKGKHRADNPTMTRAYARTDLKLSSKAVNPLPLLQLHPGMRVIIRAQGNISTALGLANGVTGVVYDLLYAPEVYNYRPFALGRGAMIRYACQHEYRAPILLFQMDDQFWKPHFTSLFDEVPRVVAIVPQKFQAKDGVHLVQLPVIPAAAMTLHKVQGLTVPSIVCHFTPDPHNLRKPNNKPRRMMFRGGYYMALTRAPFSTQVAITSGSVLDAKALNDGDEQFIAETRDVNLEVQRIQDLHNAHAALETTRTAAWTHADDTPSSNPPFEYNAYIDASKLLHASAP
jgi:hypothetical protein